MNYVFEMINVTAGYENKPVIKNINLKISRGGRWL
jgi:ABC-type molybdenum transport system ATPase subunit/photorepair protein PhrA